MNIYFFLDYPELNSSLDIFNLPPNKKFCNDTLRNLYPYAFYSNGNEWIYEELDVINKNHSMILDKKTLPKHMHSESVFISFSLEPNNFYSSLENYNYMNSSPQWRANTKIYNQYTSASYQGEYPGSIISKNISLVSCSPMIQTEYETNFYLINLTNKPKKIQFELLVMDTKLNKICSLICLTNTINLFNLNEINHSFPDNFYVFKSEKFGGVPLYFTKTQNSQQMGIEHTHPPSEYIFLGDRNHFQKLKKKYWLEK